MLDQPAKRPKGRPRKQPGAESTRKQRATFCGAAQLRLESDRFNAICDLSLQWQQEHGALAVIKQKQV